MEYISSKINSEYTQWKNGDTIFITSPTGTGKSTFIFQYLLPFYAYQGKRILYLVNRSILKEQLEADWLAKFPDFQQYIEIELYQTIENEIANLEAGTSIYHPSTFDNHSVNVYQSHGYYLGKYQYFDCVVCDEAHYFLMDSNYNTNTILSYNFVKNFFSNKVRIYMSATIDSIKKIIKEDNSNSKYWCTEWLNLPSDVEIDAYHNIRCNYEYDIASDIGDISVHIFRNKEELADIIAGGSDKWLVFVDNKEYGKSLKKEIENAFETYECNGSVVFVTSDYREDDEANGEVYSISKNSKQSARVLIATSVLDNGINLIDEELRNIVIMTDSRTQFLQMLGRKRKDGKAFNLYIQPLNKAHFERRRRICSQRLKTANKSYKDICNIIQGDFNKRKAHPVKLPMNYIEYNRLEFNLLYSQHTFMMQKMMNNYAEYEAIRATCLFYGSIMRLNRLSLQNLLNLNAYYTGVLEKFNSEDENAFLVIQLSWIGKSNDDAENLINEAFEEKFTRSKNRIIKAFDDVIHDNGDSTAFDSEKIQLILTEIKDKYKRDFYNLIYVGRNAEKYGTVYRIVEQKKKTASKPFIEFLNKQCGIPFLLTKSKTDKEKLIFERTDCKKIQQTEPVDNPQN